MVQGQSSPAKFCEVSPVLSTLKRVITQVVSSSVRMYVIYLGGPRLLPYPRNDLKFAIVAGTLQRQIIISPSASNSSYTHATIGTDNE